MMKKIVEWDTLLLIHLRVVSHFLNKYHAHERLHVPYSERKKSEKKLVVNYKYYKAKQIEELATEVTDVICG